MSGSEHEYRNVLVTGATGGLGKALVERLLARPGTERVFAAARHADAPGALPRDDRVQALPLDVTDERSLARAADTILSADVPLDLVVQAAGLLHDDERGLAPEKRVEQLSMDALQRVFAVNAFGPALLARALLPALSHERRAVLVHVSARVGSVEDNHLGGWYAYRASKAAQNQLTRTLALELKRRARNAVVFAYHPGTVDTGLSAPFSSHVPAHKLFSPASAADRLLEVVDGVTAADTGSFVAWDGSPIPW